MTRTAREGGTKSKKAKKAKRAKKARSKKGKSKKRGGRPKGSATVQRPTVEAAPAACPTCGSTKNTHTPGFGPRVMKHSGVSRITGQPYSYVVWQPVTCECGQRFTVRSETNHDPREGSS